MTTQTKMARNVLVIFAGQFGMWLISLVAMFYIPKYLGAIGLGKLQFVGSYLGLFSVFVSLGTSSIVMREVARNHDEAPKFVASSYSILLPSSILVSLVAYGCTYVFHQSASTRLLVGVACLGVVTSIYPGTNGSLLLGMERFSRQSVVAVADKLLSSCLLIGLVIAKAQLWMLVLTGAVTNCVTGTLGAYYLRDVFRKIPRPDMKHVRYLIAAGVPLLGFSIFKQLYGQTDPLIIKIVVPGFAAIGWYSAATRFTGATMIVPNAIMSSVFPSLARLYEYDLDGFNKLLQRSYRIMALTGVPVAVLFVALAHAMLHILQYPRSFIPSVPVIQVGSLTVFLMFLATSLGNGVLSSNGQKSLLRSSIAAAIFGIPACAVCAKLTAVLYNNAAVGAIGSDVLVELLLIYMYARALPKGAVGWREIGYTMRCIAAAIPMCLVLILALRYGITAYLAVPATLLFVACAYWTKCIDPEVIDAFRAIAARKLARSK